MWIWDQKGLVTSLRPHSEYMAEIEVGPVSRLPIQTVQSQESISRVYIRQNVDEILKFTWKVELNSLGLEVTDRPNECCFSI